MTELTHSALIRTLLLLPAICMISLTGCKRAEETQKRAEEKGAAPMTIEIQTKAFAEGAVIPKQHTGDGKDVSPALSFSNLPEGTKELALIMDDPDAPAGVWVHWVIYKIPGGTTSLPEGIPRSEKLTGELNAMQGKNSWGTMGYRGPAPPPGKPHRYFFKLYALDAELDVQPGLTKQELLQAMSGGVLAEGQLMGTYKR